MMRETGEGNGVVVDARVVRELFLSCGCCHD
jgi:hypothetical protein